MAQGRDQKILRIGVIQNGKIIEERLLRRRDSVTIGQSPRNTFVLPSGGVPRSYTLFEVKGGNYQLNFKPEMKGRVSVDQAVLDFDQLRKQSLAKKKGDHYALPLSEKSRGKVVVDDVTLLFQFVTPPPPPSKLQLPASVRQNFFKRADWPFVSTLLASFVVQVFSIAFIVTRDYPEPPKGLETVPDRFKAMITQPPPEPEVPPEKEETKEEDSDEDAAEKKVKKPRPKPQPKPEPKKVEKKPEKEPQTPEEQARAQAEKQRRMQEKVRNNTILSQLGSKGPDGAGNILDTLKDGATDVKIADAFDGADGMVVAKEEGMQRDRRKRIAKETGKVAGVDEKDLRAKGGGAVATGKKKEKKVKGSVSVKKPSEAFGTGVLDSNAIAKVVRRRRGAVKNCYEKQLKRNPKLSGKVKVQFTILESGRVREARVVQDSIGDPAVGKCIVRNVKRWRFPRPDGGSVTVAFPFLFQPSG